ncbi:helix-turn-helix domain-containing protein [Streptomyces sp. NPDC048623]|uniref:helix-turn-helix domain-containing protein n=1 Tax=Streptomyces sp. NPDC048623 TaxID=3155761 RepID=UPI00341C884B
MLSFVGLDRHQESAYRMLMQVGSVTPDEAARRLGLSVTEAAGLLRGLEQRGLVASSGGRAGRYAAAPPGMALGGLLAQRRHELALAESAFSELVEEYRAGPGRVSTADVMEVVTGGAAIRHRFEQLQSNATDELLALVSAAPVVVHGDEQEVEDHAIARGVNYRVVIERAELESESGTGRIAAALGQEEQIRVVERVPTKLLVADRSVALMSLGPMAAMAESAEPSALVVHAPGVLEALTGLFELVWREARPVLLTAAGAVAEPQAEGPDETDLLILSLMLTGVTDRSVAKQAELGLRTVQRRIQRLMELAGVTTRMQLGWYAHEQGWVRR